jgi:hypothetical protein
VSPLPHSLICCAFCMLRDKGTVVDFVTTIRNRNKQPQGKPL